MKPKPLFPAAHVVTKLSTTGPVVHGVDEWHEPHGALQSVVHTDPALPGVMQHVRLGASGVIILRGAIAVCIPIETLIALAVEINPAFGEPPNGKLSTAEVQALAPAPAAKPE